VAVYVGHAQLEASGSSVEIFATLHTRVDALSGRVVWDGHFSTEDRAGAEVAFDVQETSGDLLGLRLRDESDSATVRIVRLAGGAGDLEGVGSPPRRLWT
jgi:Domain of unknown function (DUF4873)